MKYIFEAKYPGAINDEAGKQMNDISRNLHIAFVDKNKPFNCMIIGKTPEGEYSPWEEDED